MSSIYKPIVNYSKVGNDMWSRLLELKLSYSEYKVLHYITAHLRPGGCMLDVQQKDIASYFEMDKGTVSKVFTTLAEKDVMKRVNRGRWMLNPTVFYRAGNQYFEHFVQDYYGGRVKVHPEVSQAYQELAQDLQLEY